MSSPIESDRERLELLVDVGALLAKDPDGEAFPAVARRLVPLLGDLCVLTWSPPGEEPRSLGLAGADERQAAAARLDAFFPALLTTSPALAEPLRAGRPVVLREIPDELLRQVATSGPHLEALRTLAARPAMLLPLFARGELLGTLSLLREPGGAYSEAHLPVAQEVARSIAAALAGTRLAALVEGATGRAEEAFARTVQLQAVTAGLAGAMERNEVASVILTQGLAAMGAAGGGVALVDETGTQLEVLAHLGYSRDVIRQYALIPLATDVPLTRAVRTREAVLLASPEEWAARFSVVPVIANEHKAWASLPMVVGNRCLGALGVSYAAPRRFSAVDRDFLLTLASQCAQALERAQLFQDERRARTAAEEAVRVREEFLSVASHELRTPLTPLTLQLGSMARSLTDPQQQQKVAVARRQTERLSRLVEQLLDVSRISAGRLALEREDLDLSALVRDVLERSAGEVARAGSALSVEAPLPVRGRWDPLRLEQVIGNLVSNALKYGNGQPIAVRVDGRDGAARLEVRDSGIGISGADLTRIFQRFERAVPAREYGGLGLGLYITRQLVEAHGGTIRVESAPGRGATFVVELPASDDRPS